MLYFSHRPVSIQKHMLIVCIIMRREVPVCRHCPRIVIKPSYFLVVSPVSSHSWLAVSSVASPWGRCRRISVAVAGPSAVADVPGRASAAKWYHSPSLRVSRSHAWRRPQTSLSDAFYCHCPEAMPASPQNQLTTVEKIDTFDLDTLTLWPQWA